MSDPHLRDFTRSLPMALLKAREAVMARFRPILRDHDITEQQWRVIRALNGRDGLEITALAHQCIILMPSLTRILKALEEKGLVKRFAVENDQRRTLIRLSRKGVALFEKVAPLSEAAYQEISSEVGPDKLGELYALLDGVADSL